MRVSVDRLRTLRVADVMARDVVVISRNQAMEETAKQFSAGAISSAPVVDEQGHCVGMLSAADFLKRDRTCREPGDSAITSAHALVRDEDDESLQIISGRDSVSDFMAQAVQSIAPEATLLDAARMMCVARVHHLPVLKGQEAVGIVSSMDIVAAMVNAVDEVEASG